MLALRSLLFNIGLYTSGALAGLVSLLIWPFFPVTVRWRIIDLWRQFLVFWLRACLNIRIRRLGKLPPRDQPYVIVANHQSAWETLYLPFLFAPVSTIVKRELLRIPLFGWGLAALRPIAIDRANRVQALRQLKQKSVARLAEGNNVLIFPQGTRVAPGEAAPYARSGADIATQAGVPLLPIAHDAGHCWPTRRFLKKPGHITLVIGEPMDTAGQSAKELMQRAQNWIEAQATAT